MKIVLLQFSADVYSAYIPIHNYQIDMYSPLHHYTHTSIYSLDNKI